MTGFPTIKRAVIHGEHAYPLSRATKFCYEKAVTHERQDRAVWALALAHELKIAMTGSETFDEILNVLNELEAQAERDEK